MNEGLLEMDRILTNQVMLHSIHFCGVRMKRTVKIFSYKFGYNLRRRFTYIPGECANVAGIFNGSVSFVFPVIIINTRFQFVHATFQLSHMTT
ncbi:CLUMA_CG002291, isoform A [Clunio marinus]|uniref:CLUMA_CG002291, isoform A n=1 Tax=Clunio marinus TaxID=568069 RepID=A0A1J1HKG7_9DIPT|nr:CLUMA_CG002291, isoform A [Clunio marinus]